MQPNSTGHGSPVPDSEKLDSWKEIAAYLGKGVTTVRRWEREEGLPVRRQEHLKRGSVVALKSELDEWRNARTIPPSSEAADPRWRSKRLAAAGALLVLVTLGLGGASRSRWDPVVTPLILTADPGSETRATFAPGGQRFAYTSVGRIFVKDVGIEPPRQIYQTSGGGLCCIKWSPDGRFIAVSYSKRESEWEFGLIEPSGRFVRRLGEGGPGLSWRRDSKAVLFSHRPRGEATAAIFEHELATGHVRQVSFPPPGSWGDILGVADYTGQRIAVARYAQFGRGDLYVAGYGKRDAVRFTHVQNWLVGLDWLPGGQGIVYGEEGIYRIAEDGSGKPTLIPGTEGINRYPEAITLSDGTVRVAYVNEPWNMDLTLFDQTAGKHTPVAVSTQAEDLPDIDENGDLVYASNRTGTHELWTCTPGCGQPRRITALGERQYELMARWSPDGRHIAYVATQNSRSNLIVAGPTGESPRVLSSGTGETSPSWSADGNYIYFQSDRTGRLETWRISATGESAPVQITRNGAQEAFESHDGRELFLIRVNENTEIYRHSLVDGSEAAIPGLTGVSRRRWRPVGNAILYWLPRSLSGVAGVYRFDMVTMRSSLLVERNSSVISMAANARGQIVWSDRMSREDDIKAVDLTFRPFWKVF